MISHPSLTILCVTRQDDPPVRPFLEFLRSIGHIQLEVTSRVPGDLGQYDVVVTGAHETETEGHARLQSYVEAGGGWLALAGPSQPLPELFGAQPGSAEPCTELRLYFQDSSHPLAVRLGSTFYVRGPYCGLQIAADDIEVMLCADWRFRQSPVLVTRQVAKGRVACTSLQAHDQPTLQQILYRLLRHLAGQSPGDRTLAVGILGYSPSVGQAHALGVESTPGLALRAVCDLDSQRLDQACEDFPDLSTHKSADALAGDKNVDLVIIATPPNSHADLALQMMRAGKHVVCEKPLALTSKDALAMARAADEQGVHLSCHQNRRWDVDYLAIKQAVQEGLIGELFYVETFVGGFDHPCGLWHSHDAISGGTAYDWGAHYLDWIVSLLPQPVLSVVGTAHKRVWHDVTNADQERIHIRFAGGQEADFLHSDIAAARKPKWYLLGTEGAIVGRWRDVTTYEIDPVVYFQEHEIPATEMVCDLTLHSRHRSGQIVTQSLALPRRQHHAFYRNLADHLLTGEPLVAPLEESMRVVAILEAAALSAQRGGTVEVLDD
jgi:predicted dehydrogenase